MSWGESAAAPPVRVGESFEVSFDAGVARTRETLETGAPAAWSTGSSDRIAELHELAATAPGAAVMEASGLVRQTLADLLGPGDEALDAVALARLGVERGVVAPPALSSIEGLHILMELSHSGGAGTGLTVERAHEYIDLTRVTVYALTAFHGRS